MRRQICVVFTVLCILGCQQHPKNGIGHSKMENLTSNMEDANQVKLVVYEYLICKELKLSPGALLFVAAGQSELQELGRKFPAYHLKNEEKAEVSKLDGVQDKITK